LQLFQLPDFLFPFFGDLDPGPAPAFEKARLSGQQLIGLGMIAAMLIVVLIGALNNFGR
jgi:hypothetical protein